jgi:hypothetical protein
MKPTELVGLVNYAVTRAIEPHLANLDARLAAVEAQHRPTRTTKAFIPAPLAATMARLTAAGFEAERARRDLEAQGASNAEIVDALMAVDALMPAPEPRGRVVKFA